MTILLVYQLQKINYIYIYENIKINNLFIDRVSKDYKNIISGIFEIGIQKYTYDKNTNQIILIYKPSKNDFKWLFPDYLINRYKDKFVLSDILLRYIDHIYDDIESGPDTWWCGEIIYIKKNEVDDFNYAIKVRHIKTDYYLE
jgi:hypothetical protein